MSYEPTLASLRSHPLPSWFDDAKLGIFIHWTPASVPGWAPVPGEMSQVVARQGWRYWLANNPYTEWYANSLRIPGSPVQQYHRQTFGSDFPYEAFIPEFRQAHAGWDASAWADTFAAAGARYVVLVTKHHDGFLLWPSRHPNPHRPDFQSSRDLVGELTAAVRARGLRMGLYYSGGLDWTFDDRPIQDLPDLIAAIPRSPAYAGYVDAHWRELIERYQPSVLWNDIGYPVGPALQKLLADYYNTVPDGVINDRFGQFGLGREGSLRYRAILWTIKTIVPLLTRLSGGMGTPGGGAHADFRTPEYAAARKITRRKWEACRGIGYSFGFNRQETDVHMIAPEALVRLFVDIVSKNGNLLLNVGPRPDGSIPDIQLSRLRVLGDWLQVNGEAIYDTRPWRRAAGQTASGIPLRFTCKGDVLYAILFGGQGGERHVLKDVTAPAGSQVSLLGWDGDLVYVQEGADLAVTLPAQLIDAPAYVLRMGPR